MNMLNLAILVFFTKKADLTVILQMGVQVFLLQNIFNLSCQIK
uniref:Uncharacterized protein n=1 Tax=Anguilla anguilla TaxID=7936 RepID=A0A0E9T8I3_ANGAN